MLVNKLIKFIPFAHKFRLVSNNKLQKHILDMNKVYFRGVPCDNKLEINFRYKNEKLNIDREFNFNRKLTEEVGTCLDRIKNNIEKECLKKIKKQKVSKKEAAKLNSSQQVFGIKMSPLEMIQVQILKNDLLVENATFSELFDEDHEYSRLVLKIIDEDYEILYNKPWVTNLSLPTCMLSGYYIYPNKMDFEFADKEESRGIWYRGLMPNSNRIADIEWKKIHDGFLYRTRNLDVGHYIKFEVIPGKQDEFGPSTEAISKSVVQAGPGKCPFEDRHIFTPTKLSNDEFRVVTYNILADLYADSDYARKELFPYCPAYAMNIDYRKQLFIKEIIGYNSDIICLQEVDCKIFDQDLVPILETQNLNGVMQKKGQSPEGPAIFYRNDRFDLLKEFGINIGENIGKIDIFEGLSNKISYNKKLLTRTQDRATTLQVALLKFKESERYLLVANTHLYFHPDADHIRLLQMGFCMLVVEDAYQKALEEYEITPSDISILFCGDFNSTPDCGIYKLMTDKVVDELCPDWRSNKSEAVRNVILTQPFNIESACGCPKYTNFTKLFSGCLDYIFYQTDHIEVKQIIPVPSDDEIEAHSAIPSVVFPSDHISLVADLKWNTL